MTRPLLILCECCGSEGRIYRGHFENERDCGECPACEGTGSMLIDSEPVTLEDLGGKCCDECPGDDTCEHAKVCMCGDYMDHSAMAAGHSPVSMHDYYSTPRASR